MKKFVQTHFVWIQGLLSFLGMIIGGLYVNLLSSQYTDNPSTGLMNAIQGIGYWNLFLFLTLSIFGFQVYIGSLPYKTVRELKQKIIEQILESACKSMIYPQMERHVRAVITICDYKDKVRRTAYAYNIDADPERTATFPIDFGVTGEALKLRTAIARTLPHDHISTYPHEVQTIVAPELRCVLAVPIFDSRNPRDRIIGILAFDSFETIKNIGFDTRESKFIAQSWADVMAEILIL